MATLAELYCSHHRLPAERFERHALVRSLTLQAKLVYPLLCLLPGYFYADLEFIRQVGRATDLRHFALDAADFRKHPENSRLLRRLLRLRLSSLKLRRQLAALETPAPRGRPLPA